MEVKRKRIQWTEKYRPRFLDEIVLKRTQRTYLLSWWRCWKVWWIQRSIWKNEEQEEWFAWTSKEAGREWAKEHVDDWQKFFKKKFGTWMGDVRNKSKTSGSYCYPPESQQELFVGETKTRYTTELSANAITKIKKWLEDTWEEFREKSSANAVPMPPLPSYDPLLLVGPPGNGKTATAFALSGEVGVPLVELNASDERSKTKIKRRMGRIIRSSTLRRSKESEKPLRLVLFDEVDGMHGTKDRGGFSELLRQLKHARFPVILTANDKDDNNVRKLMAKHYNTTIFFNRPQPYQIENLIATIEKKAGMDVPTEVREQLKGTQDLRTVVQALENYYYSGEVPQLRKDKMRGFKSALKKCFAFKQDGIAESLQKNQERIRSVEGKNLWDFIIWSWENASKLVETKHLYSFYEDVAYADYIYQLGQRRRAWRVAYSASRDLAYAMGKWGEEKTNIWALRKLKLRFPSAFSSYSRRKKFLSSGGQLHPIVERLAQKQHISLKASIRDMNMLTFLGERSPRELGGLLAGLNVDSEEVDRLTTEYTLEKGKVMEGYEAGLKELRTTREERKKSLIRNRNDKEKTKGRKKPKHEEENQKPKDETINDKDRKLDDFF